MRQLLKIILLFCISKSIRGQPRIRNGQSAKIGQFPYQAMLLLNNWHVCGTSIIHKRWILLAAHCVVADSVDIKKYAIAVGGVKARGVDGKKYSIEAYIAHEKYSDNIYDNDIALVRLKNDIEFNKNVSPIKLPENNSNKYENNLAVLSGWGLTQARPISDFLAKTLQYVFIRILNKRECELSYRYLIKDSHICTAIDGERSACSGDSGGPLVVGDTQVGIVSFGDGICARYRPNVHTRVSYFVPWIKQHIEIYNDVLPY